MDTYQITHEDMTLDISLVELNRLHIHEEIIPSAVDKLAESILSDKVLRHPVMVDRKSLVVLDGMHRVAALRRIGCLRMAVCLVDYSNPAIGLFGWYRTFKGERIKEYAFQSAKLMGLSLEETTYEAGINELKDRLIDALFIMRDNCLKVANNSGDIKSAFTVVKKLENQLINLGLKVGYETKADAETRLRDGKVDLVMGPPPIHKTDVINQGIRDEPFPHKVTRHTVPTRPLEIDVPLDLLKDEKLNIEVANKRLLDILNSKNTKRLPPGSIIEGRRYDEEIYLFVDK